PNLKETLDLLAGRLDDDKMRKLNHQVDGDEKSPEAVAASFLTEQGLLGSKKPDPTKRPIIVASKTATEGVLLAEMMSRIIETQLGLPVERKFGLGGTLIVHNALKDGSVDLYPEYTGTALTAILTRPIENDAAKVYREVAD